MVKHVGSCLCNAVSFEIEGDVKGFFLCHCSRCRKITGSAHASNLFMMEPKLRWLSGEEHVKTYRHPNCRFTKSFCDICGSALPSGKPDGRVVIPAGSLDTDVETRPNAHIFVGSKANWEFDLEKVEKFEELPKRD